MKSLKKNYTNYPQVPFYDAQIQVAKDAQGDTYTK